MSADSLCMVYVNRNHAYDGRLIEVRIKSGEYAIRHRAIHCGRCGAEELIRFEVDTPPKDTTCDLIVTGTCRGAVRDGVVRCEDPRIDWYVLVERCSVTVLSP